MKKLCFIISFLFTTNLLADLEHIAGQGASPGTKNLTLAQGCFIEISEQGCGHPRDDREIFVTCVNDKMDHLTPSCQSFFTKLYGKRESSGL